MDTNFETKTEGNRTLTLGTGVVEGEEKLYSMIEDTNIANKICTIGESLEKEKRRKELFRILSLPSLLYALFYTVCLYDNYGSITMPLFVVATIYYGFYCMKKLGVERRKGSFFYCIIMLLLSISSATTGNETVIFMNFVGIFLLLICLMLHNFFSTQEWTLGKYFKSIFQSIFGAIGCIAEPFLDGFCLHKGKGEGKNGKLLYVLLGIGIAIPLLFVIIQLLCSADGVFASILNQGLRFEFHYGTLFAIAFTFAFAYLSAYCGIRYLNKRTIKEDGVDHRVFEPIVAITVLSLISVVYLFFSLIQFMYLFWGKMKLPAAYTYAEYAREGFFQLLFVCILNVAIVLFVMGNFKEHPLVKLLLTLISGSTYVMLASSAFRMILYIKNYRLTFLRIFVLWMLALIAVLLVGILISVFRRRFPLFRYGLAVVSIFYLIFSFGHPDYVSAKYNLAHMEEGMVSQDDYWYLLSLSTDAAPAIAGQNEDLVNAYAKELDNQTSTSIRKWNISHAYARSLFADKS